MKDKKDEKPDEDKNTEAQTSKTTQLLELVKNEEFFHDEQRNAYVTFLNTDHFETWPLGIPEIKEWLAYKYWHSHGKSIHGSALGDALATLKGQSIFSGECQEVFTRVGHANGKVYINLANKMWQSIEVSESGWQLVDKSPIKFRGSQNMRPLPIPTKGKGNFNLLWNHINIPESSRALITAWLIDAMILWTAFPVLLLTGLQGSGKSTAHERLRMLIDPSCPNLRNPPKNSDDIATAALNNHIVSYNNVSKLTNQNQDDFCCLSTGGGFARRQLYTTGEEFVADIKRPILINGISDIITRQDLLERTINIFIQPISQKNRKSDAELDRNFEHDYPLIFTGLLDLLVKALKALPNVKLEKKPRMASFALLGKALEQILGLPADSFEKTYRDNYQENIRNTLDSSAVAIATTTMINNTGDFEGTYARLFEVIQEYRPKLPNWPTSPKGLANNLKRLAPALAMADINLFFEDKARNDGFHLEITKTGADENI